MEEDAKENHANREQQGTLAQQGLPAQAGAPEEFLAKGKRGIVFKTTWDGRPAAVKRMNPRALSHATLLKEAAFLRIANAHQIGPKLYDVKDDAIIMEFIDAKRILDFFAEKTTTAEQIKDVCKHTLMQCKLLDDLGINKSEMCNPVKHVLVQNKQGAKGCRGDMAHNSRICARDVVLIDFERCRYARSPKNVTQFLQFLSSGKMAHALQERKGCGQGFVFDRQTLRALAQDYKMKGAQNDVQRILDYLSSC